jgi:N-acetyltransferase
MLPPASMADEVAAPSLVLRGRFVRLEPLSMGHVAELARAVSEDPAAYPWSWVPRGEPAVHEYVATALALRAQGSAVPFATVRLDDARVVGSTRFFDIEHWPWPAGHPRRSRATPDACEIGYTWLARSAMRTSVNTEAKLLMLGHAFETWRVLRVCLHTDERNAQSRAAIERIGGRFEGILRAHRPAVDGGARNSARYSILAEEWPGIRARLRDRLERGAPVSPTA